MLNPSKKYSSRRNAIVNALAGKLKAINGLGNYAVDVGGNVEPRMLFWDEVTEFPAIHLAAGQEWRERHGGRHVIRHMTVTVRCYVKSEDPAQELEDLLADIEFVVEENSRLAYQDRLGGTQMTNEILITSMDTDQGALAPLGVGEILLQVSY